MIVSCMQVGALNLNVFRLRQMGHVKHGLPIMIIVDIFVSYANWLYWTAYQTTFSLSPDFSFLIQY